MDLYDRSDDFFETMLKNTMKNLFVRSLRRTMEPSGLKWTKTWFDLESVVIYRGIDGKYSGNTNWKTAHGETTYIVQRYKEEEEILEARRTDGEFLMWLRLKHEDIERLENIQATTRLRWTDWKEVGIFVTFLETSGSGIVEV